MALNPVHERPRVMQLIGKLPRLWRQIKFAPVDFGEPKLLKTTLNLRAYVTGWIGSLAFGFTVGTCPFSTPLFTVYGARKVGFVGVLGATISLVVTSFTPVLYLMFLTYR